MDLNTQEPAPDAGAQAASTASKKKLPILPVILVVMVVLGAVGGMAFLKMHGKKGKGKETLKVGEVLPLDDFMLNLADSTGDHYLKTTIDLGLKEGISADAFKAKVPQARDAILMVLTAKHLRDLRSVAGKTKLKKQISAKINSELGEKDVVTVYFQDFATQ